jgi:hypothetical protein
MMISLIQSVIARPGFLRSWQSLESSFIICGTVESKKMRFLRRPAKDTGLLRMTTRSAMYCIYNKNYSKIGGKEWIFKKLSLISSF